MIHALKPQKQRKGENAVLLAFQGEMEVMLYVCCHFKISHTQNLYQFINFSTLKRLCKLPLKGNFTISCKYYFIRNLFIFFWVFDDISWFSHFKRKKSAMCIFFPLFFSCSSSQQHKLKFSSFRTFHTLSSRWQHIIDNPITLGHCTHSFHTFLQFFRWF